MRIVIGREYKFDAAHQLLNTGPEKCKKLHGHTYTLEVEVSGRLNRGMVLDFHALDTIVEGAIINKWDHNNINNTLVEPTVENMVLWAVEELKKALPAGIKLKRVVIHEGPKSWASLTLTD